MVRRPLSAAILDDGKQLAVLSTDHKVNVYNLSGQQPRFLKSIALDNPPHTITLSPKGEVLAAAYDGGVEVHSLAENALATDQRAVKCDRVDSLAFSSDGTMLLGTTQTSKSPHTVILSAPYFTDADQDLPHTELISHMWTSQILFPNSSRDCSHATLLPHQRDGDASWTLTYDSVFESFRAVRTDDLRNGTTYFTGPKPERSRQRMRSKSRLVPCTLPTITEKGELVAAGFLGNEVWMYGVPEGLDTPGNSSMEENSQATSATGPSTSHIDTIANTAGTHVNSPEFERLPRWQVLVDKYRNVFAKGRKVAQVQGVAGMCWVSHQYEGKGPRYINERLVVAAPGGVSGDSGLEQEELASVDGGRLVILDFDRTTTNGTSEELTIEVGSIEPEMLQEENMDMATEIALVRRRTVAQRRDVMSRASVVDALRVLPGGGEIPPVPQIPESSSVGFGLDSTTAQATPLVSESVSAESPTEGVSLEEAADALDGPYSHTHPRSRNTLYRSATAVAANRSRNTARIPESGRVEYRRTDGTELPHESDADNWVPPPPPYTPDADVPLPEILQASLVPRLSSLQQTISPIPRYPQRSQTTRESSYNESATRRRSSTDIDQMPSMSTRVLWQQQEDHSDVTPPEADRDTISPISLRTRSDIASWDFQPSSIAVSPSTPRRRPVSSYEYRPPNLRNRPDYRSPASFSTPREPTNFHQRRATQYSPTSFNPTNYPPATTQLTLSGSNLQQRLDYPLPPPPPRELPGDDPIDRRPSPLEPTGPAELPHLSIPPSPSSPQHPPPTSMPSAYQLNNLQNRYDIPPVPASRRTQTSYISFNQGFPAPTPPRGALGALGRPTSSSRFRSPVHAPPEAPARSLSRSNSRGSQRRPGRVASTPNLLRPSAQRLDTIYSIASRGDVDGEVGAIGVGVGLAELERPISRFRTRSESRLGRESRMGAERRESRWMGRRGKSKGETRAVSGPEGMERTRAEGGERMDLEEKKKKKKSGGMCVVM